MGNCRSCIKPKTSDDLDHTATSRQSRRSNTGNDDKVREAQPNSPGEGIEPGTSRLSVRRPRSSSSVKSIFKVTQPSAPGQDDGKEVNKIEPSEFVRRSSSRLSRASRQSQKRNKENLVIQVRPVGTHVAYGEDGGMNLLNQLKQEYDHYDLRDFKNICSILWEKDEYLIQNQHYKFSRKGGFQSYVKEEFFAAHRTFSTFRDLLRSYNSNGNPSSRANLEDEFLEEAMKKEVVQICWAFLSTTNRFFQHHVDRMEFKSLLRYVWFRGAFQHIFVGDTNGDQVSGLHNWMQYSMELKENRIQYKGCRKQIQGVMVAISYSWNGEFKHMGSMFIGSSPEFELALYTLLYFVALSNKPPMTENSYDLIAQEQPITVKIVLHSDDFSLKTAYPVCR